MEKDTLTGTLTYGGRRAAMGTMAFKHRRMDETAAAISLAKTQCNLKIIPSQRFEPHIAQLVAYNLQDIEAIPSSLPILFFKDSFRNCG